MLSSRMTVSWLAVLLLAAALAGCGGGDDEADGQQDAAPAATGADEAADTPSFELKIGALVPFTGDLSTHGPSLNRAAEIAVEVINETLAEEGLDGELSVSIVSEDDQTKPQPAVEGATKLVQTDEVDVLVGTMSSSSFIPVAQSVTIPNQIVHIGPTVSAREITDLKDDGYVYRMVSADIALARGLAEAAAQAFGAEATVNVGARNDAWGSGLQEAFEEHWRENGGTIGTSIAWNAESPNFDTEAQQLVAGTPDGWIILEWPETFEKLGPALVRAGGWEPDQTFMTEAMAVPEALAKIGDEATVGLRGISPTAERAPAAAAFEDVWKERAEGNTRTGFEATTFDAVLLSFLGAVKAGSSDPAEIKAELQAVSGPPGEKVTFEDLAKAIELLAAGEEIDYEGAWGPIDWDENGDPGVDVFKIWQYEDGEVKNLDFFTSDNRE